jgi:adenylate cyclase class 2
MQTELEAKFLDINPDKVRHLLKENGATLVHAERLMRRKNFDYPDRRLYKIGGWIRVRDEGDKTTLSYKRTFNDTLEGTKEISIVVDDFDTVSDLLSAIGLEQKSYQETKRERWDFNGVEVTIDTWPWIPTFVELEGQTEKQLKEVADKLSLIWATGMHGGVAPVYCKYYNVTCNEVNNEWKDSIAFTPVPDWLEKLRK